MMSCLILRVKNNQLKDSFLYSSVNRLQIICPEHFVQDLGLSYVFDIIHVVEKTMFIFAGKFVLLQNF